MGCGESRVKKHVIPEASEIENFIFTKERDLGLCDINFEKF